MSNPNIAVASEIYGDTSYGAIGTSLAAIRTNAASSNAIIKINSLIIVNIDGSAAADVTATLSTASGASDVTIAHLITVPAKSNLVLISKDTGFYLLEDKSINLQASAAGDLNYVLGYEVIAS